MRPATPCPTSPPCGGSSDAAMSDSSQLPIDDDALHALVDGRLSPEAAARLQARVEADPALTQRVAAWRAQRDALSQHLAQVSHEPLPPAMMALGARLERRHRDQARWTRWGGMAAGVVLAFAAGWLGHAQWQPGTVAVAARPAPAEFARQALAAHVVYAPEVRHPVEVEAAQQDHLVQWLSKRLDRPLRVPQLGAEGFELVGGRLLPAESGARAQFMYQSAAGERITLYLGALPDAERAAATTAFRFVTEGGTSSFYWVDQGFAYALAGKLPRQRLAALAELIYRQL